ncbi:MAG: hemolysin [Rhodobacterales bacterium]|nr:MAG: hemolysin [Rhodobacterales bacterium]
MPSHSFTAFRWTGTGYNSTYNTSYDVVITDDDPSYDGGIDFNESVSIDGGPPLWTSGAPYVIRVPFQDVNGNHHVEDFYFFNAGGDWYFAPGPDSDFTVGSFFGVYQGHTVGWDYDDVACFVRGSLIQTDQGPVPVEKLRKGQGICTHDGGSEPLRLALSRKIGAAELARNPKLRPVRIMAGALGGGLPERDLLVSRQHRMLVSSKIASRMFGQTEVLVAAIRLCDLPGVFVDEEIDEVEYFHLVFDEHQVIYAENAPTESLFACGPSLSALTDAAKKELFAILPQLAEPFHLVTAARLMPDNRLQKQLIRRHLKNDQAVLGRADPAMPL